MLCRHADLSLAVSRRLRALLPCAGCLSIPDPWHRFKCCPEAISFLWKQLALYVEARRPQSSPISVRRAASKIFRTLRSALGRIRSHGVAMSLEHFCITKNETLHQYVMILLRT